MLLSEADIEAELSYAYLHAVASRAGFGCAWTVRHADNIAVDATLRIYERLAPDATKMDFTIDVQLKATVQELPERDGKLSFSLPIRQYDKLRSTMVGQPKLLVLLRLPQDRERWLRVSADQMIAERCAHWCSLYGAADSENEGHQTVYVPVGNLLDPAGLRALLTRFSREEIVRYEP